MTEIKPNLYLGGYRDAMGDIPKWYKFIGTTHVLCVASEISLPTVDGINIKHLPIADDDPSVDIIDIIPESLEFINNALDDGGTVLIHCRSGVSRAVCVTLAVLINRFNFTLINAYHFVASRRTKMNIFPAYLTQLENWSKLQINNIPY